MDNIPFLTASEQVYLQGEKFASKAGFLNKYKLMHTDEQVSLPELVTSVLAAAFLASEKAGALRLEARQKKAMLGLTKVTSLYAEPVGMSDSPSGSLEARFYELASQLKNMKGENEVWKIIYAWLRKDVAAPWAEAVERIQAGLGERQLLDVIQEKKLKIFTMTRYELPESIRELAASLPAGPVQDLLTHCRNNRPEVWTMLVKQIKKGIDKRTEQTDTSD